MAMEIFVLLLVRMIGGPNMDNEQLTTLEDYMSLRYWLRKMRGNVNTTMAIGKITHSQDIMKSM